MLVRRVNGCDVRTLWEYRAFFDPKKARQLGCVAPPEPKKGKGAVVPHSALGQRGGGAGGGTQGAPGGQQAGGAAQAPADISPGALPQEGGGYVGGAGGQRPAPGGDESSGAEEGGGGGTEEEEGAGTEDEESADFEGGGGAFGNAAVGRSSGGATAKQVIEGLNLLESESTGGAPTEQQTDSLRGGGGQRQSAITYHGIVDTNGPNEEREHVPGIVNSPGADSSWTFLEQQLLGVSPGEIPAGGGSSAVESTITNEEAKKYISQRRGDAGSGAGQERDDVVQRDQQHGGGPRGQSGQRRAGARVAGVEDRGIASVQERGGPPSPKFSGVVVYSRTPFNARSAAAQMDAAPAGPHPFVQQQGGAAQQQGVAAQQTAVTAPQQVGHQQAVGPAAARNPGVAGQPTTGEGSAQNQPIDMTYAPTTEDQSFSPAPQNKPANATGAATLAGALLSGTHLTGKNAPLGPEDNIWTIETEFGAFSAFNFTKALGQTLAEAKLHGVTVAVLQAARERKLLDHIQDAKVGGLRALFVAVLVAQRTTSRRLGSLHADMKEVVYFFCIKQDVLDHEENDYDFPIKARTAIVYYQRFC